MKKILFILFAFLFIFNIAYASSGSCEKDGITLTYICPDEAYKGDNAEISISASGTGASDVAYDLDENNWNWANSISKTFGVVMPSSGTSFKQYLNVKKDGVSLFVHDFYSEDKCYCTIQLLDTETNSPNPITITGEDTYIFNDPYSFTVQATDDSEMYRIRVTYDSGDEETKYCESDCTLSTDKKECTCSFSNTFTDGSLQSITAEARDVYANTASNTKTITFEAKPYYCDRDSGGGDGYISDTQMTTLFDGTQNMGGCSFEPGEDCDDSNKLINPGMSAPCNCQGETVLDSEEGFCNDGIDNDCDGLIDRGVSINGIGYPADELDCPEVSDTGEDTGDDINDPEPACGFTWCGIDCIDTSTSNLHCGSCNNPCETDETCIDGNCIQQTLDLGRVGLLT